MNIFKTALFTAVSVLAYSIALASPQDAVNQIKANSTEILKILNKENGSNAKAVRAEAEQYAIPYFDFEKFTKNALKANYKNANEEQKKQLVERVKQRLISKYSGTMFQYKTAKIDISDKPSSRSQNNFDYVVISSKVLPTANASQNDAVRIDYYTYKSGNKYRIFDVSIAGLPLSKSEGEYFQTIINQHGIEGLIEQLSKESSK